MADGPTLKRGLGLTLLVLYGLGTTIGAGIYVLVGKIADIAGPAAPLSFVIAALLASLSALSFGELAARIPVAAGEAAYVEEGLRSRRLALAVGCLVLFAAGVSSAAIVNGFVGYFQVFVHLPDTPAKILIAVVLTGLAIWGVVQSVTVAALFTLVEVGGLVLIAAVGGGSLAHFPDLWEMGRSTGLEALALPVLTASVLAFYAFLGFEDMVNLAEEVREPQRTMPRGIVLTLVVTALLYALISLIAVLTVTPAELGASKAPLALVYERATGNDPHLISAIGVVAVINGALIQIIMASRVLYGLAARGAMPSLFATVHPRARTPINATLVVGGAVLALALLLPIVPLAQLTSLATLTIFALVNLSLYRLRRREGVAPGQSAIPLWIPVAGCIVSAGFAVFQGFMLVAG